jgi:hypothetical protein
MAKEKRKRLRPHSDLVHHLMTVILRWTKEQLAQKVKVDPRTIDNVLGKSATYAMSLRLYDSLYQALNNGLEAIERPQIKQEELLRDFHGPYTLGLDLERYCRPRIPSDNQAVTLKGRGTIQEIKALDHASKFLPIKTPVYYGPISEATLVIKGLKANLSVEDVTMYRDAAFTNIFAKGRLTASGSTSKGYVYLVYSFQDGERNLAWEGVMVLCVPASGDVHGFWLTEGHTEHGRVVIGSLHIERT